MSAYTKLPINLSGYFKSQKDLEAAMNDMSQYTEAQLQLAKEATKADQAAAEMFATGRRMLAIGSLGTAKILRELGTLYLARYNKAREERGSACEACRAEIIAIEATLKIFGGVASRDFIAGAIKITLVVEDIVARFETSGLTLKQRAGAEAVFSTNPSSPLPDPGNRKIDRFFFRVGANGRSIFMTKIEKNQPWQGAGETIVVRLKPAAHSAWAARRAAVFGILTDD